MAAFAEKVLGGIQLLKYIRNRNADKEEHKEK